jgi:hypothetical protein
LVLTLSRLIGIWEDRKMKNTEYLPEKKIKYFLEEFLNSQGWTRETDSVSINRDIDIEVKRGIEKWIIEIESPEVFDNEITDSFVTVLGRILQRMDNSKSKYSIALPDIKPFRRLWERLPDLAKNRTRITALFVSETGAVVETGNSSFC